MHFNSQLLKSSIYFKMLQKDHCLKNRTHDTKINLISWNLRHDMNFVCHTRNNINSCSSLFIHLVNPKKERKKEKKVNLSCVEGWYLPLFEHNQNSISSKAFLEKKSMKCVIPQEFLFIPLYLVKKICGLILPQNSHLFHIIITT